MPEMEGLDATRAMRTLPRRDRTPIPAMIANTFDEDRSACLEAGIAMPFPQRDVHLDARAPLRVEVAAATKPEVGAA